MIIPLNDKFLNQLLQQWSAYQTFYKVAQIDDIKNRNFVLNIMENPNYGSIFIKVENDEVLGFATLYFTFASTVSARVAVLNDLFVASEHRGKSIGKNLLDYATNAARDKGQEYIRWMTKSDNTQAQQLYKNYATPSEWLVYASKL